jgi:hypothetical protein
LSRCSRIAHECGLGRFMCLPFEERLAILREVEKSLPAELRELRPQERANSPRCPSRRAGSISAAHQEVPANEQRAEGQLRIGELRPSGLPREAGRPSCRPFMIASRSLNPGPRSRRVSSASMVRGSSRRSGPITCRRGSHARRRARPPVQYRVVRACEQFDGTRVLPCAVPLVAPPRAAAARARREGLCRAGSRLGRRHPRWCAAVAERASTSSREIMFTQTCSSCIGLACTLQSRIGGTGSSFGDFGGW